MIESLLTIGLGHYLALAGMLLALGLVGVIVSRRNVIVALMSIEIMLLAVNINLVAFSSFGANLGGQVFAMIVLTVAAAESAIGLAILVLAYRLRGSAALDDLSDMKG